MGAEEVIRDSATADLTRAPSACAQTAMGSSSQLSFSCWQPPQLHRTSSSTSVRNSPPLLDILMLPRVFAF